MYRDTEESNGKDMELSWTILSWWHHRETLGGHVRLYPGIVLRDAPKGACQSSG